MEQFVSRVAPRKTPLWLAALLLGLLFAVNVYRAATQSITVDEAFTYSHFVAPPLAAMRSLYNANNHVLNTLLAKVSVSVFGASDFTVRLPSLLGGLAYFAGLFFVCRRLFGQGVWFLLAIALNSLNPFLLDYLSAARGYGLALGVWMWAWYALLRCQSAVSPRILALAGVLMGLSIAANLVFLVPCLALLASFVVVSTAAEWRKAGGRSAFRRLLVAAAAPLVPAAGVAGAILWAPLQMAERANFYYGSLNSKDALRSLADGLLFHGQTVLNMQPAIDRYFRQAPYGVIVAGVLALAAVTLWDVLLWFRAKSSPQPGAGRHLIPGTLFVAALLLVILRRGFGVLYPQPRTGIYFLPLLFLASVWMLSRVSGTHLIRRAVAALCALPLLVLLWQFVLEFNTAYYYDFRNEAATKRIVARLGELRRRSSQERLRVGVSPLVRHGYEFYQQTQKLHWLAVHPLNSPTCLFDYYVVLPDERDSILTKYRLNVDYYDAISGATLAKFNPGAVPELQELRALGYGDGIPCRVDFSVLGPVADVSRPDGAAHLLRDFLLPGEPIDWVWVAEKPALVLRVPDAAHRELAVDFLIHSSVLAQVGPQTLAFRVNGKLLNRLRYDTEGRRTYRQRVPAEWLRPGGITLLEMEPDKCFIAPQDGQKLGFLFFRAGLAKP
jgi:hypothetical protein